MAHRIFTIIAAIRGNGLKVSFQMHNSTNPQGHRTRNLSVMSQRLIVLNFTAAFSLMCIFRSLCRVLEYCLEGVFKIFSNHFFQTKVRTKPGTAFSPVGARA